MIGVFYVFFNQVLERIYIRFMKISISQVHQQVLTIVMVVSIMFYSDWRLALVSLVPFPVLIYATYRFKESKNTKNL